MNEGMCDASESEQLQSVLTLNNNNNDDDDEDDDDTIIVIAKKKLANIYPCDILNYFDYKLKYFMN
jgi:hypothetical protein